MESRCEQPIYIIYVYTSIQGLQGIHIKPTLTNIQQQQQQQLQLIQHLRFGKQAMGNRWIGGLWVKESTWSYSLCLMRWSLLLLLSSIHYYTTVSTYNGTDNTSMCFHPRASHQPVSRYYYNPGLRKVVGDLLRRSWLVVLHTTSAPTA